MPSLWNFVLKVPLTMHRLSNLWWQEADGSSGRQRELHQRILPALIIIVIIMVPITVVSFKRMKCVQICHCAAEKKIKTGGNKGIIPTCIYIYITHPSGEEPAGSIWKDDWKLIGRSITAVSTRRQQRKS